MTWYLGITATKLIAPAMGAAKIRGEFAVEAQLRAAGIEATAPRRIEFKRLGKKRQPQPVESAWLPGYVFANIPADRYAEVIATTKGLSPTLMAIHSTEMRENVQPFLRMAAAKLEEAEQIIDRKDRAAMVQFNPGDGIEIVGGPFFDRAATFLRMVSAAGSDFPMVEAEVEMFGGRVPVKLDPLHVRAG